MTSFTASALICRRGSIGPSRASSERPARRGPTGPRPAIADGLPSAPWLGDVRHTTLGAQQTRSSVAPDVAGPSARPRRWLRMRGRRGIAHAGARIATVAAGRGAARPVLHSRTCHHPWFVHSCWRRVS
jgi:hypothetical protein